MTPNRRRAARIASLLSCAFLLALGAPLSTQAKKSAGADEEALVAAPRAVVQDTVAQVLVILNEKGLEQDERRGRIEKLAFDVFDFQTMGKLVLARNWKRFDEDQRKRFIEEFKRHLSRNYGSRLDRYQQTDVRVFGTRIEPRNDVTVRSKVVGGQFDGIEMNYRMRKRGDDWRVIDVVIEGVSLVANFRSQFVEVVNRSGPEGLLEEMKTKNFGNDEGS